MVHLTFQFLGLLDGVFEVRSTNSDTHLGGEDFDNKIIVNHFFLMYLRKRGSDLRNDRSSYTAS